MDVFHLEKLNKKLKMTKDEIKKILPHREPMLLVDDAVVENGVVNAKYLIKEDEFFCRGHFPGNPIVPGVIQCEIMAQSCAFLVGDAIFGKTTLYTGINNVRFKNMVKPGDLCEIEAKITNQRGAIYFCDAELKVAGKLCCKGELSFALIENPA